MNMIIKEFKVVLPDWVENLTLPTKIKGEEEKMAFVIELSKLNVTHKTGGPFSAAVFAGDVLVSIGVNRVVPSECSLAHAEMVALSLAQAKLKTFDLGGKDMPVHSMYVNAQPCCMCYGNVIWSGIREVVVAATSKDVEEITGFDEGPVRDDWMQQLEKRNISFREGLLRDKACEILKLYKESGSIIYNGREA